MKEMTDDEKIELLQTIIHFKTVKNAEIDAIYNAYRTLINNKEVTCYSCPQKIRRIFNNLKALYDKLIKNKEDSNGK